MPDHITCELDDIEAYLDLVRDLGPLFTRKQGDASAQPTGANGPLDIEARLASM